MAQPPSRAELLNPSQSTYTDDPDEIVYNRLQDAITQTRRQPRAQYPSMGGRGSGSSGHAQLSDHGRHGVR
jgi:hypothetical protein